MLRRWASALPICAALCAALGAALGAAPAAAAEAPAWKLSGTMRLRYETVSNQVRPGFNRADQVVNLRTTLFAEADFGAIRVGGEMFDSRVWNADARSPVSANEVNTFEPVQAYVALDHESEDLGKVTLQAGRFMLNLGSRRLVAADDYRNTTNGYTGLRLDAAPAGIKTTLIYVMPQLRRPDGMADVLDNRHAFDRETPDVMLWGGIFARPRALGDATLEAAYFRFDENDLPGRPNRNRHLDTASVRVMRDPKPGQWDVEVEAIRQTGRIRTGLGALDPYVDVRAGFLHADAGYTFVHAWKPRLSAEFDLASGDHAGGDFGRFDTLFGMRSADLGPSGIFAPIGRTNLVMPAIRLEIAPSPRWEAFFVARQMWLDAAEDSFATSGVRDARGATGKYAGAEFEARVRWWVVPDRLRFQGNVAHLWKGRFLREAPNAPRTGDSTYVSLNLTASF